jgi:hypothetical protein
MDFQVNVGTEFAVLIEMSKSYRNHKNASFYFFALLSEKKTRSRRIY